MAGLIVMSLIVFAMVWTMVWMTTRPKHCRMCRVQLPGCDDRCSINCINGDEICDACYAKHWIRPLLPCRRCGDSECVYPRTGHCLVCHR